jgi:hypothetical protein
MGGRRWNEDNLTARAGRRRSDHLERDTGERGLMLWLEDVATSAIGRRGRGRRGTREGKAVAISHDRHAGHSLDAHAIAVVEK